MNSVSIERRKSLKLGLRHGVPIGLGYFAVSFSLGIVAGGAGLTALQGFFTSLFINASAGEYAGFSLIAEKGSYLEMVLVTVIANARYLLMACALSQRMSPDLALGHRLGVGFCLTDEIFGISIARPGYTDPYYTYGAMLIASPCWALGTALGIIVGNLLPAAFVSALSVTLYGMFLAIIIPPARKSKIIAAIVVTSFALSFALARMPLPLKLSGGTRTIILTLLISSAFAILFPVKEETENAA